MDSSFENSTRPCHVYARLFLKCAIVKPQIVVKGLNFDCLLKLMTTCCEHDIFNLVPRAKLLLKGHKLFCQGLTLLCFYVLERIFEKDFSSFIFTLANLKLSEMDEELFVKGTSAELS